MRVVLDTNVIVSRFIVPEGKSAQIIRQWEERKLTLLVSEPILEEYQRVMAYKRIRARHKLTDEQIDEVIQPFSQYATLIEPKISISVVTDDPDDNKILECAFAGAADYIVSGDAHLLDLRVYEGIQILAPAAFVQLLGQQELSDVDISSAGSKQE